MTVECINAVELLIRNVAEDEEKRISLMEFFVPILVKYLLQPEDFSAATASTLQMRLHETALSKLTSVGQTFPMEFKATLNKCDDLKRRLESAILANKARLEEQAKMREQAASSVEAIKAQKLAQSEYKPSIQLKMDFSNFQ